MFKLKKIKYKDILFIEELEIEPNKITCIVGESGGGKTTFLKLLNNIISPDKGTIKFNNKSIMDCDPIELRREIPMLPQNPVIFPGTIRENFDLTLKYAEGKVKTEKDYKDILKVVGLDEHKLDKDAENLSGGEKQRIALARILLLEPKALLLDEPSSALDEKTEELIIKMVVDYIEKQNGTLIMVTHSREIAEKFGDRIVTINNGKVIKTIDTKKGSDYSE